MGLKYGYNESEGKWYACGFRFMKLYDTEEEMIADKSSALNEYFERLRFFKQIAVSLARLR